MMQILSYIPRFNKKKEFYVEITEKCMFYFPYKIKFDFVIYTT